MLSRLANKPLAIPKGVTVTVSAGQVEIKGAKKTLHVQLHPHITALIENGEIKLSAMPNKDGRKKTQLNKLKKELKVVSGTIWALLKNGLAGAMEYYKLKLDLVGVGYRAQAQGHTLNLTLGLSHPVAYAVSPEVTVETPSQTEIVLSSANKQILGQVAAEICSYRPVEIYKGKGIRISGTVVKLKETKKK